MNRADNNVIRIYGGDGTGDAEPSTQARPETLTAGQVYRRRFLGPKAGGRYSLHVLVDTQGGASSAATVWYSNLPDPDLTSDNDWVQDSVVGTIDLSAAGGVFKSVANEDPEWVMVKAAPLVSNAAIRVFARVEGTTHGKNG